jgi:hypothetical protein
LYFDMIKRMGKDPGHQAELAAPDLDMMLSVVSNEAAPPSVGLANWRAQCGMRTMLGV